MYQIPSVNSAHSMQSAVELWGDKQEKTIQENGNSLFCNTKKGQGLDTTHHPVLGEKSRCNLCNYSTDTDRLDVHNTGALTEHALSHRQLHLSYQCKVCLIKTMH